MILSGYFSPFSLLYLLRYRYYPRTSFQERISRGKNVMYLFLRDICVPTRCLETINLTHISWRHEIQHQRHWQFPLKTGRKASSMSLLVSGVYNNLWYSWLVTTVLNLYLHYPISISVCVSVFKNIVLM